MKKEHRFTTAQPYIASYILLRKGNKLAFVLRKNTGWMDGFYGLPAGKVEKEERYTLAAVREAEEESGVKIKEKDLKFVHVGHRRADDDTHSWVDVVFEATKWEGEPHNAEPHVHESLDWLDLDNLPENIIPNVRHILNEIKAGKAYSEYGWEN